MSFDDGVAIFRLGHILESAEFLRANLGNLTFDRFAENQALVLATLHSLQIVGEASITIPDEFKDDHSKFPWRGMRRMRNIIVHQYFKVDLATLWDVIQNIFLPLEQDFRELLNSISEDEQ